MNLNEILSAVGHVVEDAEEESTEIFCDYLPSGNLGFINSEADEVDITVNGKDFTIKQSPTILTSSRAGGTTGAVLWKITPLIAGWLSNNNNFLWNERILDSRSTVAELGCGISGLIPLTLAPMVQNCIITDQEYVHKLLKDNLKRNYVGIRKAPKSYGNHQHEAKSSRMSMKQRRQDFLAERTGNITFTPLDWEFDHPANLRQVLITDDFDDGKGQDSGFDLLIACDTIYSEALVPSFVRTCVELCRLRPSYGDGSITPALAKTKDKPTLCIVAQRLRSLDVFDVWCRETMKWFHVWRLNNEETDGVLGIGTGSMVHLLVLKADA
ncbi:hypothetical protein KEM54_001553 [Ascosphaera aggregata]|nr:hypothetical protein KEM54_001553 [Ascosphaera aggregata]